MGRAIVRQPQVFLFDEPLSNLDAKLRVQMRFEIQKLHRKLGTTSLYVTHDQVEAMTLAHRMIVMNAGRAEQVGSPMEVYENPATRFVAGFIGSPSMNFLAGKGAGAGKVALGHGGIVRFAEGQVETGREVVVGIRPEHLSLAAPDAGIAGEVVVVEPTGADTQVVCRAGGQDVIAVIKDRVACRAGDQIGLVPDPVKAHVFDAASGARLAA